MHLQQNLQYTGKKIVFYLRCAIVYLSINGIKYSRMDRAKFVEARKFYIRRNNNKVNSIEIGRIVIAHLLT